MFYFYVRCANYQTCMAGIRVGLLNRLHLFLPNAALLVGAVIFKLTRRGRDWRDRHYKGRVEEADIEEVSLMGFV
jgi:hypothetical protein